MIVESYNICLFVTDFFSWYSVFRVPLVSCVRIFLRLSNIPLYK